MNSFKDFFQDALDLTRPKSILGPSLGWIRTEKVFLCGRALQQKTELTVASAQRWAARVLTRKDLRCFESLFTTFTTRVTISQLI